MTATRATGSGPSVMYRFGGPCGDYHDEIAVTRNDTGAIACVGRAILENVDRHADDMRDDKLLWARPTRSSAYAFTRRAGEFTIVRDHDHWRMDGATGEVDNDAVDAWLNALGSFAAETRLAPADAAAHGLAPATQWIEITRTGVEGAERIDVGTADADRMYASREGEPAVLGLDPSRGRQSSHRRRAIPLPTDSCATCADELTALVTDAPTFHDEASRIDGTWHVTRPVDALGDPTVIRGAAQRLATLDAERWVSLEPLPAHGPRHAALSRRRALRRQRPRCGTR